MMDEPGFSSRYRAVISLGVALLVLLSATAAAAQPAHLKDYTQCPTPPGFPDLPSVEWTHLGNEIVAHIAEPRHFARDAVTTPGAPVRLSAKMTYGDASKDLEDARVRILLQTCTGWKKLGTVTTNDEGWARLRLKAAPAAGIYRVYFQVLADGTLTSSRLWVVPHGTKVAVFDIDGTLTTRDAEEFTAVKNELLERPRYVPKMYPGARRLTQFFARRGYLVVYLTGRPYLLEPQTRRWLNAKGMAKGVLRLTTTNAQVWPSAGAVGVFKLAEVKWLRARGLDVRFGFGNATTDIGAYLGAGLPAKRVWIIGPHAGAKGTHAAHGGWKKALTKLRQHLRASAPPPQAPRPQAPSPTP